MNIAFFGGCINRQFNLTPEQHYHAIVRQHIIATTNKAPGVGLYFYSSYHQLQRKVHNVLNGDTKYDCVVVFIRPFPLIGLTKFLVRYTDKQGQNRLTLHPIFTKQPYYDLMMDETRVRPTETKERFAHRVFQGINDTAGDLLNLRNWAMNEVMTILRDIEAVTGSRGIKLILAGPMLYPANERISKVCKVLNERIEVFSTQHNIAHIDLATLWDSNGNPMVHTDNKHLTAVAHAYMADEIIKYISLSEKTFGSGLVMSKQELVKTL